jgi:late competence protein required for DNA uptake (superfamily II DNA/RNA helicase)
MAISNKLALRRERLHNLLKDFRSEKIKTPDILFLLVDAVATLAEREKDLTVSHIESVIHQLQERLAEIQEVRSAQTSLFDKLI